MAYPQNPTASKKIASEISSGEADSVSGFKGQKIRFPNPPDAVNPDPSTLREQWRFACREYNRCYARAWGGIIIAGISSFALGWVVKGGNPTPYGRQSSNEPKEVPK